MSLSALQKCLLSRWPLGTQPLSPLTVSPQLAPASLWVRPMPRSAEAGDATPRQDSATANQVWRGPTATGVSWATGASERTAVALVTVPETATSVLETVSMGKEALLRVHFEMGSVK